MRFVIYMLLLLNLAPALSGAEPQERKPEIVAQELLTAYGKKLPTFAYIPAMALHAKLRYAAMTKNPELRNQVEQLIPDPLAGKPNEVGNAGHLLLASLSREEESSHKEKYLQHLLLVAENLRTNANKPPPHTVMSDNVFMVPPLLCEAGALSGNATYFETAETYLQHMVKLRMREDGIYQHGHLCDAAWGRGNGFPALGFAWCLSNIPAENPAFSKLMPHYKRHMQSLLKHQDSRGFWHQVIDHPESYAEYTCTAMIGFAMQRGIRQKWLPAEEYQPVVNKAWQAICTHTHADGKLVDVCEGTGTQSTLEAYLQRKAIRGHDDRGGAMGLLFATERMATDQ